MERIIYQVEESRAGKGYQAFCPELLITGFGDTISEAREALRRQVSLYLEDCEEEGMLEQVLSEAGFYHDGDAWVSERVTPIKSPRFLKL